MTPELDEVTFGTAVANRASVGAQALIGPFVNIVVIRLMTPGDITVRELLRSTRAALLDAFADQDVPFDRVIETLHPATPKDSYGPTGGEPLFRVCVDFTEDAADGPTQTTPNLTITPLDTDDVKSGCDVYLNFSASRETLRANVLYSAELFERGTAVVFVDRLQAILGSLDRQLDCRLAEVHS
jgi:non-ribosomal peptide synthetase component F